MIIQGKYVLAAPAKVVWNLLMDFEVLERITPGISQLQLIEQDKYKTISTIKIGPVKGIFEGQLEMLNKVESSEATLVIDQKSKIGIVSAKIRMQLRNRENTTEIEYKGEAKLAGKIAMMGQRILGGVINSMSKQFFEALDNEIKEENIKPNSYAN